MTELPLSGGTLTEAAGLTRHEERLLPQRVLRRASQERGELGERRGREVPAGERSYGRESRYVTMSTARLVEGRVREGEL